MIPTGSAMSVIIVGKSSTRNRVMAMATAWGMRVIPAPTLTETDMEILGIHRTRARRITVLRCGIRSRVRLSVEMSIVRGGSM